LLKRALISTFKKDKVVDIAKALEDLGVEIISTGGTASKLIENGIKVISVEEVTDFPEILGGRVKTLNPMIHGAILARRDNNEDMKTLNNFKIEPIDLVYVNLYPFLEETRKPSISLDEIIEYIDIGGPTMIRAAAKNYKHVFVLVDDSDAEELIKKLKNQEEITLDYRLYLALKAFQLTAFYDSCICRYLEDLVPQTKDTFSKYITMPLEQFQEMRYGENPHQKASFYQDPVKKGSMTTFEQLQGKELSYNNLRDAQAAWRAVNEYEEIACCAVKHNTPCGIALGSSVVESYKKAYECDPVSIFGGIVSFNRKVDAQTAALLKDIFLEIVMAPDFEDEALKILQKKKNLRILKMKTKPINKYEYISIDGGMLVQEVDNEFINDFRVVTETQVPDDLKEELLFAWKAVKHVKSNAIVVSKNKATTGIGGGQTNRIWAAIDALERSKGKGAEVLASDAFFPFSDVVEKAAEFGIKAIIQPGGSIRDDESIEACNKYGIAMVFTDMRHFKH
jgi:phosphoribosylaminoimidazolecarboxamide formyltransferase/IMP cyclohydrolase